MSIIEAMSVGLPILASEVTGNVDTIEESKTGFFYELGNRYQAAQLTKNRVIALADDTLKEISQLLKLDNEISALGFLRIEAENEESAPSANQDDASEMEADPSSSS